MYLTFSKKSNLLDILMTKFFILDNLRLYRTEGIAYSHKKNSFKTCNFKKYIDFLPGCVIITLYT